MSHEKTAYAPMGSGPWKGSDKLGKPSCQKTDICKEVKTWRESEATTNIPSFEVWCAATCYDSTVVGGGAEYRALKYWASVMRTVKRKQATHRWTRGTNARMEDTLSTCAL